MRCVALVTLALSVAAAGSAAAQSPASRARESDALKNAAFADRETYAQGEGPVKWRSGELKLSERASVRIDVGGVLRTPGGLPLNVDRGGFETESVDVTLVKRWPGAVSFSSDGLTFDVAPHAGVGVGSAGGQAEGGAMLTVSKSRGEQAMERMRDLGVRDGASLGDKGRWYLFAAASGRAVGLNMLPGERGWDRAGWTTDPTGALVGDAQAGVGWRKGDMQSSFGVIHREVKGAHMIFGQHTRDDTVAAFTFSLRPQR